MPQLTVKQLELDKEGKEELLQTITNHWAEDSADLEGRGKALTRWIRLWRAATTEASVPEQEASNFHVPLILWQILNALAKEMGILFGEDTEVVVRPRGKTDIDRAEKIRKWMNYRVRNMGMFRKYYDFVAFKKIFGNAIAFLPWVVKKRQVKNLVPVTKTEYQEQIDPLSGLVASVPVQTTVMEEQIEEVVDYQGLELVVENLEDWVVPKSATTIEDANHFIRRLKLTVDEILELRDQGKIDPELFKEDDQLVEKLYKWASEKATSSTAGSDSGQSVREERDEQAGQPSTPVGSEDQLVVYNWFGKFRPKDKKGKRSERAKDVVAFVLPDQSLLLGAAELTEMFPDGRKPFVKSDNIRDPNRFWSIGQAELLESISMEMDTLYRITTDAGLGTVGPIILFEPASGFDPKSFKYEPYMCIPTANAAGVRVLTLGVFNAGPYVTLTSQLMSMAERLSGITETQMGRQMQGPNAPRTYGQQAMLQAESNTRLFLDMQLERETYREILKRIWEADKRWLPKPIFFRVTEEEPGDVLTKEEMQGDYDFDITPPLAVANKAQMMQEMLQAYALVMQNPVAMQNPGLIAEFLRKIVTKMGQGDLSAYIPDVSQFRKPMSPEEENIRILQGEDVDPHPQDNHIKHIEIHSGSRDRIAQTEANTPGFLRIVGQVDVIERFNSHIKETQQAMKTQGASINMMGGGQSPGGGMMTRGAEMVPQGQQGMSPAGPGETNPANPTQGLLAGLLNRGGVNLG